MRDVIFRFDSPRRFSCWCVEHEHIQSFGETRRKQIQKKFFTRILKIFNLVLAYKKICSKLRKVNQYCDKVKFKRWINGIFLIFNGRANLYKFVPTVQATNEKFFACLVTKWITFRWIIGVHGWINVLKSFKRTLRHLKKASKLEISKKLRRGFIDRFFSLSKSFLSGFALLCFLKIDSIEKLLHRTYRA